jgi:glucuronoarabinoxylan endo-1,4-beta-xylanase
LVALVVWIVVALQAVAQTCTVDWNNVYQRIDGFGASCAFSGRTWQNYTANIFFSTSNNVVWFDKSGHAYTNNGLGLSLLRNQIQPGGYVDASELSLMKLVQPMGVRIWSTPWSPQASFKDNDNTIGGNFLSASNQAYAAQLANYVVANQANGINIYAVSIQNEPDADVGYVSCHWTDQQIHDFATNLYNAFVASNVVSTKVMLPEDESWQTNLYLATMSDPNAAADVGIIANHNYVADNLDGDQNPPAVLPNYGKPLWETEVSTLSSFGVTNYFDPSITNAMYWATRIHLFMTVAQASAWHYWYLITGTSPSDNEGLMGTGDIPSKRMFAVGQFSRFVRPNYYRIEATNDNAGIMISAYKDSVSPNFAIVAINTNTTDISETFNLTNFNATLVTPWMTTGNLSLESQTSVPVSGSSFMFTLPAMSVVTFVGQATPTLYISKSSNTVTVYWQNVPGWNLYQNSNLAAPGGWSVDTSSTTSNGTNYLYVTPSTGNLFFRLSNP